MVQRASALEDQEFRAEMSLTSFGHCTKQSYGLIARSYCGPLFLTLALTFQIVIGSVAVVVDSWGADIDALRLLSKANGPSRPEGGTGPEESKRFLEAAKKAEASNDPKDLERALKMVAPRRSAKTP
jgi:hypothetical protein